MQFTLGGLKPTIITEGFGGNSFNSTHLVRTYGLDKKHDMSKNDVNIAQLFSATDMYHDKPMIGMTEAKGKKEYITSDRYTWKLRGYSEVKLRVVEVVETSVRPGENQSTFDIVLDKPWFREPDVIIGENNKYPIEIVGDPKSHGLGWRYTCQLQTDDNSYYLPVDLIQVGKAFIKRSTAVVSEDNNKYGTIQFNSIFELESQLGMVAEKLEFTDKMLRVDKNNAESMAKTWAVPFRDKAGKVWTNFMPMAEAEMMNQIYDDIEWALVFGRRSTRTSPNGYLKRTGAGLRQLLESGHTLFHNGNLSLAKLDEWLSAIYRGRKDASPDKRKIVLMTGEMGAIMFHNMVAAEASSFHTTDTHYIRGNDFRHLSYGAQFSHYVGKNGLDVTVLINPMYDNPDYCMQRHPMYTDTCIDSWRMDILDFGVAVQSGVGAMGDNITMVAEKYADYYFTTAGKWDPQTGMPINDGGPGLAGGVSGYSTHVEKSFGLWIKDISRCGSIQLRFAA